MQTHRLVSASTLALALYALCSCAAQRPARRAMIEIDRRIWVVHQDQHGNYWFGSNGAGVYRLEDDEVSHYDRRHGLAGGQVRGIYEDAAGTLLVSCTTGVSKFDGSRFVPVEFVDEPTPLEDWELDPDDLWLVYGPGERGPVRYDGEKLHHMQLTESPAAATRPTVDEPFRFDPATVYTVYQDRRGHLWFGTAGHGLCRYDGETLAWMYEEHLTTTPGGGAFGIRSIFEDRRGDFWICNTRRRFRMAPEAMREDGFTMLQYESRAGLPKAAGDDDENFVFLPSIDEDESGALWMATAGDGVVRFADGEVTRYPVADGAYVCCVMIDDDGMVWASTLEHGVYVLQGERFVGMWPRVRAFARSSDRHTS